MKKLLIPILILCIALPGCTGGKYRITGSVDNLDGWMYMWSESGRTDSVKVENGSFVFEGPLTEPFFARIYNRDGLFVFIVPDGSDITVTGDPGQRGNLKVEGSPLTDNATALMTELSAGVERIFRENPGVNVQEQIGQWMAEHVPQAIEQNRDNIVGVLALVEFAYYMKPDQIIEYAALLSPKMQSHSSVVKEVTRAEQKKLTAEGSPFIDITLRDTAGTEKTLSDYTGTGKYVLVDFWASWCGPCVAEIPALRKVYEEFHPKGFEIFGVSLDKSKEAWTKAIDSHGMNWVHVSSLQGWDCPAAASYAVRAIPAMFLIGPDGTILKANAVPSELRTILAPALN